MCREIPRTRADEGLDKLESTDVEVAEEEGDDWETEETEAMNRCPAAECQDTLNNTAPLLLTGVVVG